MEIYYQYIHLIDSIHLLKCQIHCTFDTRLNNIIVIITSGNFSFAKLSHSLGFPMVFYDLFHHSISPLYDR